MFSNQRSHGWIAKRLSSLKKAPDSEIGLVVEAIGIPLVLLDRELRVVLANSAFSQTFQVTPEEMENNPIYELSNGSWDVSQLREPLEEVASGRLPEKDFAIVRQCPTNGRRRVLVSASRLGRGGGNGAVVLLRLEDAAEELEAGGDVQHVAEKLREAEKRIGDLQVAVEMESHERQKAEAAGQGAREELGRAEDRIEALQKTREEELHGFQKAEREFQQAYEELKKAEDRIEDLQGAVERESQERQKAEMSKKKLEGELKKNEGRIGELQEALVELQREVDERSRVDEVNRQTAENLIRAEGRLADLEVSLQKELEERRKLEESSRQAREKLKRAEERLSGLHSANQRLQKELSARKKSKEAGKQSRELTEAQFKEVRKDFKVASEQLQSELADSKLAEKALRGACMELKKTKEYLEAIIKNSPDPVISTDRYGKVVVFNKGAEDLLGYRSEDVVGRSIWELYESEGQARELLKRLSENGGEESLNETILKDTEGNFIPVLVSASTIKNEEGNEAGTIWFKKDLRERKGLEEKLRELAERDHLTSLFNRLFFIEKLKVEFQEAVRNEAPLSLIVLGVDNFRTVNESHGHQGGDCYLQALAAFVRRSVRPSDIVARHGGDELAVLLPNTRASAAEAVARRLKETIAALEVPFGNSAIRCTVSIGTAESSSGSVSNANDLLKAADKALEEAKKSGVDRMVAAAGP